ncbi:MAG: biopolymer transporter ExbD [Acidobacteria bacterium]|nr:biopolymer transporter ExbD [Acidobacteriota bacterium]
MGMDVGGSKAGAKSNPNIVPLIDVLLVLLIIFMVITPLTPQGLETLVPQPNPNAQANEAEDIRTVVVSIDANRQMMINQEPVTIDTLGARLLDIFKTRAERTMFVKGDPEVMFADVAMIIDIAKGSGVDKVGLMTEEVEGAQ